MDQRGPGRLEQLLALASTLIMAWFMLPEHQRRLMLMRATERARSLTGRLARAEGYAGMGDELAGRNPAARYGGAYMLARARDELGRVLERMRP